ncbi:glycoside hydrolase family 11 protein [Natronoflexus pectinivorans]|uniref:Endo-1,4-beta-xylanase n=1 Tax=Natronoflexus pectinivorans TaxID=682526 RepID=A0A4R2GK94_9BACT|nr:glycoside hydrolase family 11 protein [Natronoflexus pectinivorans]TCO09192.1 ricin-type beta-trefoil lectin protein [Natronoflexus pectinivorans]
MKRTLFYAAAFLFLLSGCSEDIIDVELIADEEINDAYLKSYESGTHDGYFWALWTDDRPGWVNYQNGPGGNYSVSWDYSGNFTAGKGWNSGTVNRIVGYNIGVHNHSGGGVFGYYGWTRNPLIEYYVNERWGNARPTGEHRGTVTSDGATYDIYTAMRVNAPSIDGTQTFRQVWSTRRTQAPTGQNRTITFANHVNAWASVGLGLGSDWTPAAILLTEAYGGNSQGSVNATVWLAGQSGGSGGGGATFYRIQNRATGLFLDGMGRISDGSNLGQYAHTNHQNAHWVREASGGFERFRNRGTGLYIDGMGRTSNGADAGQWANTNHNNAQWSLESAGDGYFRLRNRGTGLYLDGMGRTSNGADVGQWVNTNHHNAHWRFVPVQ